MKEVLAGFRLPKSLNCQDTESNQTRNVRARPLKVRITYAGKLKKALPLKRRNEKKKRKGGNI